MVDRWKLDFGTDRSKHFKANSLFAFKRFGMPAQCCHHIWLLLSIYEEQISLRKRLVFRLVLPRLALVLPAAFVKAAKALSLLAATLIKIGRWSHRLTDWKAPQKSDAGHRTNSPLREGHWRNTAFSIWTHDCHPASPFANHERLEKTKSWRGCPTLTEAVLIFLWSLFSWLRPSYVKVRWKRKLACSIEYWA